MAGTVVVFLGGYWACFVRIISMSSPTVESSLTSSSGNSMPAFSSISAMMLMNVNESMSRSLLKSVCSVIFSGSISTYFTTISLIVSNMV